MMRLFIALPLPSPIESLLKEIIEHFKPFGGKVKWVDPRNIHLTIKFLGETDPELVPDIKKSLDRVIPNFSTISCEINKLGAFPNLNRPRVFWAGLSGQLEILSKLAKHVDLEMHALGFEKESRKFKPHLTLGRVKRDGGLNDLCRAIKDYSLSPAALDFGQLVLFKSTLTPQGPVYERLYQVNLDAERFQ